MEEVNTINKIISLSNPITYIPKMMFFTKGKGIHKDHLTSFELALRDVSIGPVKLRKTYSVRMTILFMGSRNKEHLHKLYVMDYTCTF